MVAVTGVTSAMLGVTLVVFHVVIVLCFVPVLFVVFHLRPLRIPRVYERISRSIARVASVMTSSARSGPWPAASTTQ